MKKGTIVNINEYELQTQRDPRSRQLYPVKNTYVNKKTGEIVKINWIKGKFRVT